MDITDKILKELGFKYDNSGEYTLDTDDHTVSLVYHDIWMLSIDGKPKHCSDDIYIEDYFTPERLIEIIRVLTGEKLTYNEE